MYFVLPFTAQLVHIKSIDISNSSNICCYLGLCVGFGSVCWLVLGHHGDFSDGLSRLSLYTESMKSFQFFVNVKLHLFDVNSIIIFS